jgi:hypothetical protein
MRGAVFATLLVASMAIEPVADPKTVTIQFCSS